MKVRVELTLKIVRTIDVGVPITLGQRTALRNAIAAFVTSIKNRFPAVMKAEDWDGSSDAEILSVRRSPCRWGAAQADVDYVEPLRADMDGEPFTV